MKRIATVFRLQAYAATWAIDISELFLLSLLYWNIKTVLFQLIIYSNDSAETAFRWRPVVYRSESIYRGIPSVGQEFCCVAPH